MASLTVTVITKNEAHNIAACLASVGFADQIVVLDSGSTDGTVDIAKALGAEVIVNADWQGFGVQKNRALALARHDWVLSIDADERLSPALQLEVQQALTDPQFAAYAVPRLSSFCGQYMRHSGWYPDYVVRLFRRGDAQFSSDLVHEKIIAQTPVGRLKAELLHETYRNLEQMLDKSNAYSTAGASNALARGKSTSVTSAVAHGAWAFFRTYFLRLGFLDGRRGFLLAASVAQTTFWRYAKLCMLREQSDGKPL